MIPGFPARPELVPVPAPEIADVATPQLSPFYNHKGAWNCSSYYIYHYRYTYSASKVQSTLSISMKQESQCHFSRYHIINSNSCGDVYSLFQKRLPKKIPKEQMGRRPALRPTSFVQLCTTKCFGHHLPQPSNTDKCFQEFRKEAPINEHLK